MARTKASTGAKMSSVKSSKARAASAPPSTSSSRPSSSSRKSGERKSGNPYAGANPYQFRETPVWQKPITKFFSNGKPSDGDAVSGSSKQDTPVKNSEAECSQSDDEGETDTDAVQKTMPMRLRILDASVDEEDELPELDGEDSHKIGEYFSTVAAPKDNEGNVGEKREPIAGDKENRAPKDNENAVAPAKRSIGDLEKESVLTDEQLNKKTKVARGQSSR